MRKAISFVLLLITTALPIACETSLPKERIERFIPIYASTIYSAYNSQLQTFVTKSLERYPLLAEMSENDDERGAFLRSLTSHPGNLPANLKAFHMKMIKSLRSFLDDKIALNDSDKQWQSFLDDFAVWIFTEVNLQDTIKEFFVETTGIAPLDREIATAAFPALIENTFDEIKANSRFGGCTKSALKDPNAQGDLPSQQFRVPLEKKEVLFIRTPNVIEELPSTSLLSTLDRVKVNEEFIRFAQAYALLGKRHLYINLQTNQKSIVHPENWIRSKALEELDRDFTKDSLGVITLDKNSSFYLQDGFFDFIDSDTVSFKEEFLTRMFTEGCEFYWTKLLDKQRWHEVVAQILEDVHTNYFAGQPFLSTAERRDFIELTYLKIIDSLQAELQPDSVNITCHVSIDRAPSMYTLYYFYRSFCPGADTLPTHVVNKVCLLLFSPGLYTENRLILASRVSRFVSAARKIVDSQKIDYKEKSVKQRESKLSVIE